MPTKSQELVNAYRTAKRLRSGAAMAEALGVTRATVSNWAMGKTHMTPSIAYRVAEELGLNPADTIIAIEQERSLNLADAQAWGRIRRVYIMSNLSAHLRRKKALTSLRASSASAVRFFGS